MTTPTIQVCYIPEHLLPLLLSGACKVIGLPRDAHCLGTVSDNAGNLGLVLQHPDFESVPAGRPYPEVWPAICEEEEEEEDTP